MNLNDKLLRLEANIESHHPELYKRLNPGIDPNLAQELQQSCGRFLPQDVIELLCWKNGAHFDPRERNGKFEFLPLRYFLPLESILGGCIVPYQSPHIFHFTNPYWELGLVEEGDKPLFFILMESYFKNEPLDDTLFCPGTRIQKKSLPLADFGCAAELDPPDLRFDSVFSMVRFLNLSYEEGFLVPDNFGGFTLLDSENYHALWQQLNPFSEMVETNPWKLIP